MLFIVLFLMFISVSLLSYTLVPLAATQAGELNKQRNQQFLRKMDRVLQEDDVQKAYRFYIIAPVVLSVLGLIFAPPEFRFPGVMAGVIGGVVLPNIWIKHLINQRKA